METVKTRGSSLFPSLWSDFFGNEPLFPAQWLSTGTKELLPAANIRETRKAFIVELVMPGFEKEDFVIDTDQNILIVRA